MPIRGKSQIPNPKSQTIPKSKIRKSKTKNEPKAVASELALPKKRRGRPRKTVAAERLDRARRGLALPAPSPVIQKLAEEKPFTFPAGYGDNRIVAMVRDPYWIYVYWEVSRAQWLRVYDTDSWHSFDLEITGKAISWYVKVPACNHTYCVEVGYKAADGSFVALARSNWVTTPLDRMSDVIDKDWVPPDWEKLYSLSGGRELGKGSSASGGLFSPYPYRSGA